MSISIPVPNQTPELVGHNLFESDPVLRRCVGEGAENGGDLHEIGGFWSKPDTRELARLANENPPRLRTHDRHGRRIDTVEFHPAYHGLMSASVGFGLHGSTWEKDAGPYRHVRRAAALYMTAQTECGHVCPMTMTHASVATLKHQAEVAAGWVPTITARAYDRRLKPHGDKAGVTLGMGLTEKHGGTDVRANSTKAEPDGEAWRITGHKWFLSAPMSDAFLVTAQTKGGVSCFLMPRVLEDGSLNAIHLQRLKDKLGNRSNASSEAEFEDAHATLIGEEGRGIAAILDMVTLTRLDCALASAGLMRAGLAEAVHHARHRSVFGAALIEQPLMARVLADLALDAAAATALSLRLAEAFDMAGGGQHAAFARVLTPAVKYLCCKMAPAFLYEAMECLGGNGYVEESGLPRLYREAPVNAIWEGSGNVMALDLLRAISRAPETVDAVLEMIADEGGEAGGAMTDDLRALARTAAEDEGSARLLTEQLALTAAAASLQRHFPGRVADAYAETRLGRPWRATYGMLDASFDARALVEEICPPFDLTS